MAQVSLYLNDQEFETLRKRAERSGLSMSKYTARLIEQDSSGGGWPESFWNLFGAIDDMTFEALPDPSPDDVAIDTGRGR